MAATGSAPATQAAGDSAGRAPPYPHNQTFWFSNDRPTRPFADTSGWLSRDILDELGYLVGQVTAAGCPMFLVADYTFDRIRPAHAVRVLIPGLETTNPLFSPRARATAIRDILPRD